MSYGIQSAGLQRLFGTTAQDGSSGTGLRPFANLDLSEDQRTKIRSILKTAKSEDTSADQVQQQIAAVLTTAQLTQLQSDAASNSGTAQSGGPPGGGNPFSDANGPFANLNLSSTQQSQIASILSSAKSQGLSLDQINAKISATLTSTQQATFAQDLQNLPSPPHGPPPGASGSTDGSSADSSSNLFANLDLTADQKSQIQTILKNAKSNGTSQADTLAQIEDVLTTSQQGIFFEDVQNAPASVSGLFQSGGDGTATSSDATSSATSAGLSETDVQNQIAAAKALILQQLQSAAGALT